MITIIIPTYNHAKYLPRALAAILDQRQFIKRIIVINDGSQDETNEIMSSIIKYHENILYINLELNKGVSNAFKVAFPYVDTEYFAFAAADDFLMPNWAEYSLAAMDAGPKASICISNSYFFCRNKAEIRKNVFPYELRGPYINESQFRDSLLRHGIWFSSNTILFRTPKYDPSFFVSDLGTFADGMLLILHGLRSGVCVVHQPLGAFMISENSMSGSVAAKNSALPLILALGNCLFKRFTGLIDAEVASKIFRKCIFIYFNESIKYLFDSYVENISKNMDPRKYRLISVYFYLLQKVIYLTSFLLFKKEDILIPKIKITIVKNVGELQRINDWEISLNLYFRDILRKR